MEHTSNLDIKFDVPNTYFGVCVINGPKIKSSDHSLNDLEQVVFQEVKLRFPLNELANNPVIRNFRDLYSSYGMDPTKDRIASEALIRRIHSGQNLWRVNNVIDAMNLASALYGLPIGVMDYHKINFPITVRKANVGEPFVKIGGKTVNCSGKEIVVADNEKILDFGFATADTDLAKVTDKTKDLLIVVYATDSIEKTYVNKALDDVISFITRFAGGEVALRYLTKK